MEEKKEEKENKINEANEEFKEEFKDLNLGGVSSSGKTNILSDKTLKDKVDYVRKDSNEKDKLVNPSSGLKRLTKEEKERYNKIRNIIIAAVIILAIVFGIVLPLSQFHNNEKEFEKAVKRYLETYTIYYPTGKNVRTITLNEIYNSGYIKGDYYNPYTRKACSATKSWVKVTKSNNEYKYYTYLDCGFMKSSVDHNGPTIKLNGNLEIDHDRYEKYKELGVKSVSDATDGNMKIEDVEIDSKDVNTDEVGTYYVTYTATDALGNKTVLKRKINVVQKINNTVNREAKGSYFKGDNPNNYIYISGQTFRILGVDGDLAYLTTDYDIANVNYDGIENWLNEVYYEHLPKTLKDLIVKTKYCNDKLTDDTISTYKKCSNYTNEKNVHYLTAKDVNNANDNGNNYLIVTRTWLANKKSDKKAYATDVQYVASNPGKGFESYDTTDNLGVRPVIAIDNENKLVSGNGTKNNPYLLGEFEFGKANDKLNTRLSGEYIEYSNQVWRIMEVADDKTIKVISNETITQDDSFLAILYQPGDDVIYNPKKKDNIGYVINNEASNYVDSKLIVNHEIDVKTYEDKVLYGKEKEVNKYKVKYSIPSVYDMYSAYRFRETYYKLSDYWLKDSSKKKYNVCIMSSVSVPYCQELSSTYDEGGIRLVIYLKDTTTIVSGNGTLNNPYVIA